MITKICSKCKIEKTLDQFHKGNAKFGLKTQCKKCIKIYRKQYFEINKERILAQEKIYRETHKEQIKEINKVYRRKNKEKIKERRKIFYQRNGKKYYKHQAKYNKIRYNVDINYRILTTLRNRLHHALIGHLKASNTMKLIGCSVEQLKQHLEKQFKSDMTWDNYGYYGWHIDHIRPCASFDLDKFEEQARCFHYSNLQPLWEKDNLEKNCKWEGEN